MSETVPNQQRAATGSRATESNDRKLAVDMASKSLYATDGSESVSFRSPMSPEGEFSAEESQRLNLAVLRLYSRPDLALWEAFHSCRLKEHLYEPDPWRDVEENGFYYLIPQRCRACNATCYVTMAKGPGGEA